MSLLNRFQQHVTGKRFFEPGDQLIVGCSGGIDSVTLCDLLFLSGNPFSIAHMNFQLRGQESERDAAFVRSLAESYKVSLHYKTADTTTYAEEHSVSIQVAARELRYAWFNELIKTSDNKRTFILTAHHGDDAIETSVMHFFRGTGIRGLTGIPERNNGIIRPLLRFSRDEIAQYAKDRKLGWVEDSSNASEKYTRNYVRNQLIPSAEKMFPAVKQNLGENLRRFSEVNEIYQQAITRIRKKLVIAEGEGFKIPVAGLINSNPFDTILFECFNPFGFHAAQVPELLSLCTATSGKRISSSTHTVTRNRNWLLIHAHHQQSEPALIVIEDANETVEFSRGKLYFRYHDKHPFHIHKNSCFVLSVTRNRLSIL